MFPANTASLPKAGRLSWGPPLPFAASSSGTHCAALPPLGQHVCYSCLSFGLRNQNSLSSHRMLPGEPPESTELQRMDISTGWGGVRPGQPRAVPAPDPVAKRVCRACSISAQPSPRPRSGALPKQGHLQGEAEPRLQRAGPSRVGVEGGLPGGRGTVHWASPPGAGLRALGPPSPLFSAKSPEVAVRNPFTAEDTGAWGSGHITQPRSGEQDSTQGLRGSTPETSQRHPRPGAG